jgi:hypothetical protein
MPVIWAGFTASRGNENHEHVEEFGNNVGKQVKGAAGIYIILTWGA